jgi:ABC-2 type transport system permease protein
MVFSILLANKLIARHVERGSMTYLLTAPVKRSTVAFTQMKVLLGDIFFLILYVTLVGIIASEVMFPGGLDISRYLLLNVGNLCLHFFIAGICFLCSCIFNDTKYSVGFGAGIPALSFVIQMLSNAGDKTENLKYITFFTLFDADGIVAGEASAIFGMIILFLGAVILFSLAVTVFSKKDLHI